MRWLIALTPFLGGCAVWSAWNAGLHDPVILASSLQTAQLYQQVGNTIPVPYVGTALSILALFIGVVYGGWKLKNAA